MDETRDTSHIQPVVVIHLSEDISQEAIDWLSKQISGDKANDNCQLNVEINGNLLYVRYVQVCVI